MHILPREFEDGSACFGASRFLALPFDSFVFVDSTEKRKEFVCVSDSRLQSRQNKNIFSIFRPLNNITIVILWIFQMT